MSRRKALTCLWFGRIELPFTLAIGLVFSNVSYLIHTSGKHYLCEKMSVTKLIKARKDRFLCLTCAVLTEMCGDADRHGHRAFVIHQRARTACCHHLMGPVNFIISLSVRLSLRLSLISSRVRCPTLTWISSAACWWLYFTGNGKGHRGV